MKKRLKRVLSGTSCALLLTGTLACAAEPIRIGDIASYTGIPLIADGWKKGFQLRVDEINAQGGVLGQQVEVISRDDKGRPQEGVRLAQELIDRDKVCLIVGGIFSHVALAISDVCKRTRTPYVAWGATDKLLWQNGHRYVFRVQPSMNIYCRGLLDALGSVKAKRWATVASNYEAGHAAIDLVHEYLPKLAPETQFVAEQWPPLGHVEAGPVIQAISYAQPDALMLILVMTDELSLVREGRLRGFFKDRQVASFFTGWPELMQAYPSDDFPEGWTTMTYRPSEITDAKHRAFYEAYRKRYHEDPVWASLIGYLSMQAALEGISKAGSTDAEKIVDAMAGMTFDSPMGSLRIRPEDHQSTMGVFAGKTAKDSAGKPTIIDWKYYPGEKYLPDAETVRKLRMVQ